MAFRWRADDDHTLDDDRFIRGFGALLLKPIYFFYFSGEGSGPLAPPPLDPRMVPNTYTIR